MLKMIENRTGLRPAVCCETSEANFVVDKSDKILSALALAFEVHKDDFRRTGEAYIYHCMAVADNLCRWDADEDEIIAGLLHDTVEDHPESLTLDQIRITFGERIAHLVDGVTKLKSYSDNEGDFETLKKVTKETLVEPGIAKIKLADRLHNMQTMDSFPQETRVKKAKESLVFYVPLAESLGLWQVKNALADISFSYIDPVRYKEVKEKIDMDP